MRHPGNEVGDFPDRVFLKHKSRQLSRFKFLRGSVECGMRLLPVLLVLCQSFKHWVDEYRVKSDPRG